MTFRVVVLAVFGLSLSAPALSAGHEDMGFYFGGGVTSIEAGDNCPVDLNDPNGMGSIINSSYSNTSNRTYNRNKCEEKERGYKFFSGYRATERFGVELGYMAADGYGTSTQIDWPLFPNQPLEDVGTFTSSSDVDLFYAAVLGYYPLFENASVFGKMGVHKWKMETEANWDGRLLADSAMKFEDDGTGVLGGVGAQYDFADLPLSLRGELNHAQLKKGDKLQIFTLSLILRGL